MEILKQLPDCSVDCVITDPPYMNTGLEYDNIAKDELDLVAWFNEIIRVAKPNTPIVIFSSGKFTYKMVNIGEKYFRYELIWVKNIASNMLSSHVKPLKNHEIILIFTKIFHRDTIKYNHGVLFDKSINIAHQKDPNISRHTTTGGTKHIKDIKYKKLNNIPYPQSCIKSNKNNHNTPSLSHPSEKPFELIEKLVKMYSNEGDLVLDTFSGSGVVAHVCKYHKREFIACEIDIKYYNMSISRLNSDLLI